jgi:phosphocarrier protein HPr
MDEPAQDRDWIEGSSVIQDPTGLHARPAVKLTKLAKTFLAAIEIRANGGGEWTNAKSPNAVMKLKAGHGLPLYIRAAGEDARAAVDALVALVDRDFNDG